MITAAPVACDICGHPPHPKMCRVRMNEGTIHEILCGCNHGEPAVDGHSTIRTEADALPLAAAGDTTMTDCPKCSDKMTGPRYCAGTIWCSHCYGSAMRVDHLVWTCARCGYQATTPTHDQRPPQETR